MSTTKPPGVTLTPEEHAEAMASLDRSLAVVKQINARFAAEAERVRQYTDELLRRSAGLRQEGKP
jgi:hypothetical protein